MNQRMYELSHGSILFMNFLISGFLAHQVQTQTSNSGKHETHIDHVPSGFILWAVRVKNNRKNKEAKNKEAKNKKTERALNVAECNVPSLLEVLLYFVMANFVQIRRHQLP